MIERWFTALVVFIMLLIRDLEWYQWTELENENVRIPVIFSLIRDYRVKNIKTVW